MLNVFKSDFVSSVLYKNYHDCSANLMQTKVNGIGCDYDLTVLLMNHILLDYNLYTKCRSGYNYCMVTDDDDVVVSYGITTPDYKHNV